MYRVQRGVVEFSSSALLLDCRQKGRRTKSGRRASRIAASAFRISDQIHVVCREGELGPLVNQLQAHRLDIVLADEPASSNLKAKTFNHRLGRSGVTFCAVPALAAKLRRNFPLSLNGAPALL